MENENASSDDQFDGLVELIVARYGNSLPRPEVVLCSILEMMLPTWRRLSLQMIEDFSGQLYTALQRYRTAQTIAAESQFQN